MFSSLRGLMTWVYYTGVISIPSHVPQRLLQYKCLVIVRQNDPCRTREDRPDSLPTPIWFPTEYTESRFDRARMAR